MSDDWIENVASHMIKKGIDTNNEGLTKLGQMTLDNPDKIMKSVTSVNVKKGEIIAIKIDNYSWEK